MGNFELSPLQFSRGGIELTQLVFRGGSQEYLATGPTSLHDKQQLDELIRVGDRGIALLSGQFNQDGARRTNDGLVIHFMTNLVIDSKADTLSASGDSELISATMQRGHPSAVVYKRAFGKSGELLAPGSPTTYGARNIDFYLKQPLKDNVKLARERLAKADPAHRIQELSEKVAALEERELARKSRTVFAIGNFSISFERQA